MKVKAQDLREYFNDPENNNLTSYLNHCKKMGYTVYQKEGLVIYGFGFIDEGVPADVYFLPGKPKEGQPFSEFINEVLSNSESTLYDMIFAPLRMRNPNLGTVIQSMKYDNVSFGPQYKYKSARISFCKITFNLFYGNTTRAYPAKPDISELPIVYNGQIFPVRFRQLPDEWGRPVYFEEQQFPDKH
ncbi:hypothetical protein ACEN9X_09860 [Mucilaginibacter sp. Mucisp86]|uniref:hypothetical protein n=1 Tax=Mucilaginibacter sp. Mucisp86 TaxID=3243060 RepID=UPI0039B4515F